MYEDGPRPPPAALAFAERVRRIVGTATALHARGEGTPTPIRCTRRPKRKRCDGRLEVQLIDIPRDVVRWRCPRCGDAGEVYGWRGESWDLDEIELGAGPVVQLELAEAEHEALFNMFEAEPVADAVVCGAVLVRPGIVRLRAPEEAMIALAEAAAAEYTFTDSPTRRRRLGRVCDLLDELV